MKIFLIKNLYYYYYLSIYLKKSITEANKNPEYLISDYTKMTDNDTIHIAFQTLGEFIYVALYVTFFFYFDSLTYYVTIMLHFMLHK